MTEGIGVALEALCKLISGEVPSSKKEAHSVLEAYCEGGRNVLPATAHLKPEKLGEELEEEPEGPEEEVQDLEGLPTQA